MTVQISRRRLVSTLLAALIAATMSLFAAAPAPASADGTVINPAPCYISPGLCLSFDPNNRSYNAFSLIDVTTTPYYISIYNMSTGTLLAACGWGTSCDTGPMGAGPRGWCHTIKAYIGYYSSTPPPPYFTRESGTLPFCGRAF